MPKRSTSLKIGLPKKAPAILLKICIWAGWTPHELLRAIDHSMRVRGNFNSLTAIIPDDITALPSDMPVFDVKRTTSGWAVVIRLSNEWVRCSGGGTARFDVKMILPEAVLIAASGKPIAKVVEHPLLDSPDFVIISADVHEAGSRTVFVFAMPDCDFPA